MERYYTPELLTAPPAAPSLTDQVTAVLVLPPFEPDTVARKPCMEPTAIDAPAGATETAIVEDAVRRLTVIVAVARAVGSATLTTVISYTPSTGGGVQRIA